jgi:hypothetical protein
MHQERTSASRGDNGPRGRSRRTGTISIIETLRGRNRRGTGSVADRHHLSLSMATIDNNQKDVSEIHRRTFLEAGGFPGAEP